MEKTYNGWKTTPHGASILRLFDGLDPREMGWHKFDKYDLAPVLKDYVEEILSMDCKDGLALSYALAFVSEVNFREIAEMMLETYADEEEAA